MIDVERAVALQKKGWSLRQLRPNSRLISVLRSLSMFRTLYPHGTSGSSRQPWSRSITQADCPHVCGEADVRLYHSSNAATASSTRQRS